MRAALFCTVFAALLVAGPTPSRAQSLPTRDHASVDARATERRAWGARVRDLRAAERAELDSLTAVLRTLPAGPEAARAQRDLESAKRAWRRRALEAQLERARTTGRPEHAARLTARLQELRQRELGVAPGGVPAGGAR